MLTISKQVNKERVCHYIGYNINYKPPARILSLIDDYVDNVHHLIVPAYSYTIRDIERIQGNKVIIDDSITFESQIIARLLEQCHKVSVFLATIGEHVEEMSCQLVKDGHVLQAAVLDAIGSDAVGRVADLVQNIIGEIAIDQGLVISPRFSPGYCDWDISQQEMLFRAVDSDSAGIRLTEGCLMIPRKSISAIIGIGPPGRDVENYNPCLTCSRRDCRGRRHNLWV